MAAKRHLVRLYKNGRSKGERQATLDPTSETRLRDLLEQLVEGEVGHTRFRLDQGWRMDVHALTRGNGAGRLITKVSVDKHGNTVMSR